MSTETTRETGAATRVLTGRCQCGAVAYRVEDAFLYSSNCHCSRCRAATGAAFKPYAGIEREKLEIVEGRERLMVVGEPGAHDTRCAACGSLLFSVVRDGAYAHVAMGSLVDVPSIQPGRHIFASSKAPWFEITDDMPQFEGYPRELTPAEEAERQLGKVSAISLVVSDLAAAKRFYGEVFGVPVVFEDEASVCVTFGRLFVNLLHESAAGELVDPAPVAPRESGSRFQLSIWVDDVAAVCALLEERGVRLLTGPTDRPWGMRTATFVDPDGHSWEVAQRVADDGR